MIWFIVVGGSIVFVTVALLWFFLRPDTRRASCDVASSSRVVVIGAGAAGMACAFALSRRKEFKVVVVDSEKVCGGVATSATIPGFSSFNDGVQGGALDTYATVLRLHKEFGCAEPSKVALNVAFGVGKFRWTNYDEYAVASPELIKLRPDIRAFATLMERVYSFGSLFMLIDICTLLRWLNYSPEFIDHYVLALTALFFGTGNQTRAVPAAVMARVFCDPEFQIFRLDRETFVGKSADFFAFSNLNTIYQTMQKGLERSGVVFRLGCGVARVHRSEAGCRITLADGSLLEADRVVFACAAPTALGLLAEDASLVERFALSGVRLYSDVTYTHTDEQYMREEFGWDGRSSPCMYMIRPYPHDPSRGEMGFVLSNYQAHLGGASPLFQTIYLDQEEDEKHWTLPALDRSKVVLVKWWKQFAHSRQHFLRVVPFVRFLQSPISRRTVFCGSWTMVNTHEAATISGLAAAFRLGADYPFEKEGFAFRQFEMYLSLIHGM